VFLEKLYDRYTSPKAMKELKALGDKFILEFADHWPFFLKNNTLTDQLVALSSTNLIMEKGKAIKILANKNIFHPDLLQSYFNSFMAMTDKNTVKKILKDFLSTFSYVGNVHGVDSLKLTQTIRRIYKTP
jgi:hypothetical protein